MPQFTQFFRQILNPRFSELTNKLLIATLALHIVHEMNVSKVEAREGDSTPQDEQTNNYSTNAAVDIEIPPGPSRSRGDATERPLPASPKRSTAKKSQTRVPAPTGKGNPGLEQRQHRVNGYHHKRQKRHAHEASKDQGRAMDGALVERRGRGVARTQHYKGGIRSCPGPPPSHKVQLRIWIKICGSTLARDAPVLVPRPPGLCHKGQV